MAWLHSAPTDPADKTKQKPKTRLQKLQDINATPDIPDVGEAEYLIAYWQSVGMVGQGGMGMVPLSASELSLWNDGVSAGLAPWEFSILLEMSRAYVSESHRAEDPAAEQPYGGARLDREAVARRMADKLRGIFGDSGRTDHD